MKPFLETLKTKEPQSTQAVWLMRQAGRYLPEYRKLREERGSFLNLVYSPEDAAEVTLQPIRRYGMDGAILFSDILIVPHALGCGLEFQTGVGPVLTTIRTEEDFKKLSFSNQNETYEKIYQTCRVVRQKLKNEGFNETCLIGFAGAPWTVACYMIQGHGKSTFPEAKSLMEENNKLFEKLIEMLVRSTIVYLRGQIDAGAEAIQIFESWASLLQGEAFVKYCLLPTQKIINALKESHPNIPILAFPKTPSKKCLKDYANLEQLDGLGLSYEIDSQFIKTLPKTLVTQGYLNPQKLLEGGKEMTDEIKTIHENTKNRAHIFNLGHGVIKETDPKSVALLVETIRGLS